MASVDRRPGVQISNAVGQPTAERPYGGRPTQDLPQHEDKHNGRKLAIVGGVGGALIVAAGLGAMALGSKDQTPTPTQNPGGGIVEPSGTPAPTFDTESPVVVIPSESPVVTPPPTQEATPKPTPEATPELKTLESIVNAEKHPKVDPSIINEEIIQAYQNNPSAGDLFTLKAAKMNFKMCQVGTPGDPENLIESDRVIGCFSTIKKIYDVYHTTGDNSFYQIASDVYNYAINALPNRKAELNSALLKK